MKQSPGYIRKTYNHYFELNNSALVAIQVSARCKSAQQIQARTDEDLRVEINGLECREATPQKNIQLFNVPPAFNGSKLRGLEKTVVYVTALQKGRHVVSLIPKLGAKVEEVSVRNLSVIDSIFVFNFEERAEDGDRRPWVTFVLVDLPLKDFLVDATVTRRLWDSDDLKVIVNDVVKRKVQGGRHKYWYILGGILGWITQYKGEASRIQARFAENLEDGIHYVELHADRMPLLHKMVFNLSYAETLAERRAVNIIRQNSSLIRMSASEFNFDPALLGAVIYQEQAMNVNFIDFLSDYIAGRLGINTSIGIAQIRINTAKALEGHYPELNPISEATMPPIEERLVRIERLKNPLTNIRYAAAKIAFSLKRWDEAGFAIESKPEIVGTLYNIDDVDKPITPHGEPKPNDFGTGVGRIFKNIKIILEEK